MKNNLAAYTDISACSPNISDLLIKQINYQLQKETKLFKVKLSPKCNLGFISECI